MADRENTDGGKSARKRSKTKPIAKTANKTNKRSISKAIPVERESTSREEVETMAEQDGGNGRLFSGFADSILGTVRSIAARYIDTSQSFAKQMLDFQAQTTSWAKETPMGPFFQSQYSLGQGLVDFWAGAARALWRIDEPKPEN
jgi:hypothetical protein